MKRLVFAMLMALAVMTAMPANAQKAPQEYQAAEAVFDSLPPELRVEIQLLMTASGYWFAFPGDAFSPKFFEALKTFQVASGLKPNGQVSEALIERLFAVSKPQMSRWRFAEMVLPGRPTTMWIPAGLGLRSEESPDRIRLSEPQGQIEIYVNAFPKDSLQPIYDAALQALKKSKANIKFSERQDVVAMISYEEGNRAGHWQFHIDKYGVIGFNIKWNARNSALAGDRIMLIMGGSLIAATDRTSFPRPYTFDPSSTGPDHGSQTENHPRESAPGDTSAAGPKARPETVSSGTGFFVNANGHLLTNAHVVNKCRNFAVTPSGDDAVAAKLVAIDAANDLALLRADTKPSVTASIRTNVKLGEPIAVFGYPLSSVLSRNGNFTLGNVTALAGLGDDSNQLQISAPVQPGNSGGPLVDQSGNLVGVVVSKLNAVKVAEAVGDVPQNVNFAIKASVAVNFLTSNGIPFTESSSLDRTPLDPVALAEKAKNISALILCK